MKTAVYAGSFDPITLGHLWMIEQGATIFDRLIVAIGVNPDKRYTFSLADRCALLEDATGSIAGCEVDTFESEFLVNYASAVGAGYILRGIRNLSDYTFERAMRNINSDLDADISTVFLMPPRRFVEVSSSMVKGLVGPRGWEEVVRQYVTPAVFNALKAHHDSSSS